MILPLKNGRISTSQMPLKPSSDTSNKPFLVRHVQFAPKGNGLVYVDWDCNLYYR